MINDTIAIVPLTADKFDVSLFDINYLINGMRHLSFSNVTYNGTKMFLQTPDIIIGENCIQRFINEYNKPGNVRLKMFFFDDGSDSFNEMCDMFSKIDNKFKTNGFDKFRNINRDIFDDDDSKYCAMVRKVGDDFDGNFFFGDKKEKKKFKHPKNTKFWSTKLSGNVDNLKTPVYKIVNGNTVLYKPKTIDELSELLPIGSKIRMVITFTNFSSSHINVFKTEIVMIQILE